MSRVHGRTDRTARLLSLQMLLYQYPEGLKVAELARKYATSTKTIYRDLKSLESELGVPIWEKGSQRGVVEGYFLPPVNFSSTEAINIFLSIRLMERLFYQYNPNIASTFMKLITIVPLPVREQIQKTLEHMQNQPMDKTKIKNFYKLTDAWLSQKRVKIRYQGVKDKEPSERIVEPYFIEPVGWTHSNHLICYCHSSNLVRSYNIDRIIGDVLICPETYEIPKDFNAIEYLDSSWSVSQDQKIYDIKLKFSSRLKDVIRTTTWHPSQKVEAKEDGSSIMTLKTQNTVDFIAWILGWGNEVEVLEPKIIRDQVKNTVRSILEVYREGSPEISEYLRRFEASNIPRSIEGDLTDRQWAAIENTLPAKAHTGRPRKDDRNNINGILWVLKNNAHWNDVPRIYGAPSTCHSKFKRWCEEGIWQNIWDALGSN